MTTQGECFEPLIEKWVAKALFDPRGKILHVQAVRTFFIFCDSGNLQTSFAGCWCKTLPILQLVGDVDADHVRELFLGFHGLYPCLR